MTKEELAARLNGREYGSEITSAEEKEAKAAGLLVVFGASDDLTEFRGAIHDEAGAYGGADHRLVRDGEKWALSDDEDCECSAARRERRRSDASRLVIEALWCSEAGDGPAWTFKTALPHTTFDVMEDGEVYCRGIVVEMPR